MAFIAIEKSGQHAEVLTVNRMAFGGYEEVRIIERLRRDHVDVLSLVASDGEKVTGHIMFSPLDVEVDGRKIKAAALAPISVLPDHQRQGIGSALIRHGLSLLKALGFEAVLVVGLPEFYGRFGFSAALTRHISSPFQGLEAFMGLELNAGVLSGTAGMCRYPDAFGLSELAERQR